MKPEKLVAFLFEATKKPRKEAKLSSLRGF